MEYMGGVLMRAFGIPCPDGIVLDVSDNFAAREFALAALSFPCVLKAQVEAGGRGKAGGVQTASSLAEARMKLDQIFGLTIKNLPVKKVYIVPKVEIAHELYLSVMLDRDRRCPVLIFSRFGGMDIEQVAVRNPGDVQKIEIDPLIGLQPYHVAYVASKTGLEPELLKPLQDVAARLYRMFCERDTMLVEINPLVKTGQGGLMALDAKVVVDDSALTRQPEVGAFRSSLDEDLLTVEARACRFLYIPLEPDGRVAVMSNGSGMIMSCMDLISKQSVKVGAALDLGGGATSDRVAEGIRIVFKNPEISVLFINIFGGITRCDEIAGGIAAALEKLPSSVALIVRMEGTNKEKGLEILDRFRSAVTVVDNIREGVAATVEKAGKV
ncbi:MAG: ADP-forming succinate--CoA ligase subunit beta [Kiritimatiellales bacterium]